MKKSFKRLVGLFMATLMALSMTCVASAAISRQDNGELAQYEINFVNGFDYYYGEFYDAEPGYYNAVTDRGKDVLFPFIVDVIGRDSQGNLLGVKDILFEIGFIDYWGETAIRCGNETGVFTFDEMRDCAWWNNFYTCFVKVTVTFDNNEVFVAYNDFNFCINPPR